MNNLLSYLREFNTLSVFLRLVLACFLGACLGIDREKRRQAAGLRTYYAVCLGAALTMLLGQYLNLMLDTVWAADAAAAGAKTDVARFGAQVINGIGFLGAGAILVTQRRQVRGLTTAASLWACACMGIAIGIGFYELVLFGFLSIWIVLVFFEGIDKKTGKNKFNYVIRIAFANTSDIGRLLEYIKSMNITLNEYEFGYKPEPYIDAGVTLTKYIDYSEFISGICLLDYVTSVKKM